jgi:transposase
LVSNLSAVSSRVGGHGGTGIAWRDLPQKFGYGSGVTCWRRLRDWQAAGARDALHRKLLVKLNATGSTPHLLVDATGIPLAVALTGGNRHDVTQLIPLAPGSDASAGLSSAASRTCTTSAA